MSRVYLSTTIDGVKVLTPATVHWTILDDPPTKEVIAGEVVDPTTRQIEATS